MLRAVLVAGAVLSGCNLLTLDGLQVGEGGGTSTSLAEVASSSSASSGAGGDGTSASSAVDASSSATGGGGSGGDAGAGAAGGGGSTGSGGAGGGCGGPTFCSSLRGRDDLVVCDDFDDDQELDGWELASQDAVDPVFEVVDDRFTSCPHAARIQYGGVRDPAEGGWAEIGRRLDGVPTGLTMKARIFRVPTIDTPEGNLEILWRRGTYGCYVQARFGLDSVEVSGRQYSGGDGVVLGDDYVEDDQLDSAGRWMDVELSVRFGAGGMASVTLDGVSALFGFEGADATAVCDEGPDPDSVVALVGPPYNSEPTVLYVDDYVVTATY